MFFKIIYIILPDRQYYHSDIQVIIFQNHLYFHSMLCTA